MQMNFYDKGASKIAAILSINSDLLQKAKDLHINLSQTLEQRPKEVLLEEKRRVWVAESQKAIEDYNRRIEAEGVFSDGLRRF